MKRGNLILSLFLISILVISGCNSQFSPKDSGFMVTCILENQGECPEYDQDGNLIVNILDILLSSFRDIDRSTSDVNATIQIQNVNMDDGTLDIFLVNDGSIGGFQFELFGITIEEASGGSAEEYGWAVSISPTTVLGFSLTGVYIPVGEGVLTTVNFSDYSVGDSICFGEADEGDPNYISFRDYNGATNGGNYHVIFLDMAASW